VNSSEININNLDMGKIFLSFDLINKANNTLKIADSYRDWKYPGSYP
jgi:hypothetical protein